jgi:hypothetical protein
METIMLSSFFTLILKMNKVEILYFPIFIELQNENIALLSKNDSPNDIVFSRKTAACLPHGELVIR